MLRDMKWRWLFRASVFLAIGFASFVGLNR